MGVHLGQRVEMMIRPAPPDTGIVFVRTDLSGAPTVKAHALNVNDTRMSTRIEGCEVRCQVATVEHLMSAFAGLGIDNAYVDIDNEEVPIMDGSAAVHFSHAERRHRGAGQGQALYPRHQVD